MDCLEFWIEYLEKGRCWAFLLFRCSPRHDDGYCILSEVGSDAQGLERREEIWYEFPNIVAGLSDFFAR